MMFPADIAAAIIAALQVTSEQDQALVVMIVLSVYFAVLAVIAGGLVSLVMKRKEKFLK